MTYLISYDLTPPSGEAAYKNLLDALRANNAVRILLSQWLVQSNGTPKQVADFYLSHIQKTDRLFVTVVPAGTWAHWNILNPQQAGALLS